MKRLVLLAAIVLLCGSITAAAAETSYTWTGMRNPCKEIGEDGLSEKQLSKKIGTFITLQGKSEWAQAIFNVNNKFPGSRPWVTWAVGDLKDATPLTLEQHEEYLAHMDALGVDVFLEVWPSGKDVVDLIDTWLPRLKHHPCVKGFGVDLEYYKPNVDDAVARMWDQRIKSHGNDYRLLLKHWEQSYMPATYRGGVMGDGKRDLIFINTSCEAPIDALNKEFAQWADHFAPAAVAFQIGYPADEDGMDGSNKKGWWRLDDPIKQWGDQLRAMIKNRDQEIGLLWVTAKSGKSYNAKWDLTKGAKVPKPQSPPAPTAGR